MKTILTIAGIFLTFISIAQKVGFKKISGHKYSIQYPATWRVDTTRNMGTELILYSPLESKQDQFSENVNLIIQNLRGRNIDLKKYKEITDQQLKELGGDSKVFQSLILQSKKGPYFRIDHQMTQENRTLRFTIVCYIKNETAYLMTFTSAASEYERYKNVCESIMQSLIITR